MNIATIPPFSVEPERHEIPVPGAARPQVRHDDSNPQPQREVMDDGDDR
jgi:hypothetical protein